MKVEIEGAGTVSFAMGRLAKNSVSLRFKSKHNQLEADKMPAKEVLKMAKRRVKQANITDIPAKGTMNMLATTITRGIRLK
jgi:hypothetical protein